MTEANKHHWKPLGRIEGVRFYYCPACKVGMSEGCLSLNTGRPCTPTFSPVAWLAWDAVEETLNYPGLADRICGDAEEAIRRATGTADAPLPPPHVWNLLPWDRQIIWTQEAAGLAALA